MLTFRIWWLTGCREGCCYFRGAKTDMEKNRWWFGKALRRNCKPSPTKSAFLEKTVCQARTDIAQIWGVPKKLGKKRLTIPSVLRTNRKASSAKCALLFMAGFPGQASDAPTFCGQRKISLEICGIQQTVDSIRRGPHQQMHLFKDGWRTRPSKICTVLLFVATGN